MESTKCGDFNCLSKEKVRGTGKGDDVGGTINCAGAVVDGDEGGGKRGEVGAAKSCGGTSVDEDGETGVVNAGVDKEKSQALTKRTATTSKESFFMGENE